VGLDHSCENSHFFLSVVKEKVVLFFVLFCYILVFIFKFTKMKFCSHIKDQ